MLDWLERQAPKLVLAPSFAAMLIFVYGFIAWTGWVSLTRSRLLPKYELEGFLQYERLFASPRWDTAVWNLIVFGALFITISMALGLLLAILLDQRIRTEGVIRTIYLYPMALSMIVTGTAWKWILNPGLGLEAMVRGWGFEDFSFDWLVNPDRAIYTIVIAAVWQASGFVMALFLAGLRSVDSEIIKAAQVDGIPTHRIYSAIIIPSMAPIFLSAFIVLAHLAVKSFDLRDRPDRRRPRLRDRPSGHLHVRDGLQPGRYRAGRRLRHGDDDDRVRGGGPVSLLRAAGAAMTSPALRRTALRWLLFLVLGVFALWYLAPLFVMVTTSIKPLEEIRTGSLLALPRDATLAPWAKAWSGACTGITCEGLRPYFWNSVVLAVPAVADLHR